METLAEIDSCIGRLSKMEAQEAFFHPDFVRLLSLLKFPYLYDGNGTEVPKKTINGILSLVSQKAESITEAEIDGNYDRYSNTCAYVLSALSCVRIDSENADYFVRTFLRAASGGSPPLPSGPKGGYTNEHVGEIAMFEAASHRDGVFQRMLEFRSTELCGCIAERISRLLELRESAIYLFSVALDQSSGGVELGIDAVMKLNQFARRWKDAELPSAQYKRTLDEGEGHFSEKMAEFERLASALLRQMRGVEKQRLARVYDIHEFRAKWKEQRMRQAAIARDDSHLARRLKICTGRY